MPSLARLLRELRRLGSDPSEIRLPGAVFDDAVDQARDVVAENPESEADLWCLIGGLCRRGS